MQPHNDVDEGGEDAEECLDINPAEYIFLIDLSGSMYWGNGDQNPIKLA